MEAILLNRSSWLTAEKRAYKLEQWQFTENKTTATIAAKRNGYGGVSVECGCSNSRCRHFSAIAQADKEVIAAENATRQRGVYALADGSIEVDHRFYQLMGDVRQNRGGNKL